MGKVLPYDLLHIAFYELSPFTGSVSGFRYRIEKSETEAFGDTPAEKRLKVWLYPEPYEFFKTPEEQKIYRFFPFSEEALTGIAEWLSGVSYEDGEFLGV